VNSIKGVDWIDLARSRVKRRSVVIAIIKLWVQ